VQFANLVILGNDFGPGSSLSDFHSPLPEDLLAPSDFSLIFPPTWFPCNGFLYAFLSDICPALSMCLATDCRSNTTWPAYIYIYHKFVGKSFCYIGIWHNNLTVPETVTLLTCFCGFRFKSGPRYRNLSFFVVFLNTPRQIAVLHLKLAHSRIFPRPFHFISAIRSLGCL
jgi:hypothetical protein